MNERVESATKVLADTEAFVASERASLQGLSKKTKEDLTKQKNNVAAELQAAKDKAAGTGNGWPFVLMNACVSLSENEIWSLQFVNLHFLLSMISTAEQKFTLIIVSSPNIYVKMTR